MKKIPIVSVIGLFVPVLLAVQSASADTPADLKQAEGLYKARQYVQAGQAYLKVTSEADPNKAADLEAAFTARKKLPLVYLATDRLPQAKEAVQQLLTRHTTHERLPHAVHEIIEQAKALDKTLQAGQLYQSVLTAQPEHPQAIWLKMGVAIANTYLDDNKAVDATLQNIIARHGTDERSTEALGQIAWALRKLDQHEAARKVYRYVVDTLPRRDRTIFSQRGAILCSIALDDLPTAATGMEKLLADYAESKYMPEIVRNIASEYSRRNDPERAVALHQYVVDKHPTSPEALWCQRDIALWSIDTVNAQATEAALQELVTSFADDPRLPEALAGIGEHYRKKGDFPNARVLHQMVVSRFPTNEEAVWSQRNLILSDIAINDESRIQESIQTLLTQFEQDTDFVPVLCYVADRLGHQGNGERLKLYKRIIDQHPTHELAVHAQAKVGQIQILQGNTAAAESLFDKLMAQHANRSVLPEIVHLMAAGYYERAFLQDHQELVNGQARTPLSEGATSGIRKAIERWNLILEQLPAHAQITPMACFYTANAYYQLGDCSKALQYCTQMLDRWPEHTQGWRARMLMATLYKRQMKDGTLPEPEAMSAMAENFNQMLQKHPTSPGARAANMWLQQYRTSGGQTAAKPQTPIEMAELLKQMLQKYPASAIHPAAAEWLKQQGTSSEGGQQ